jgi:transposase
MEGLTLNRKEQNRLIVLNQVERQNLEIAKAGVLLGLSERQVWRLLSRYRKEGAAALAHGNRGRKPANTLADDLRHKVVELYQSPYAGFNHQHFTEKLAESEDIHLCRSSVRNILLEAGMPSPRKRKPPRHRSRRPRYPQEGMLLQTDGSPHPWLEDRGPELCLIGAIDDATSKVPYAFFSEQEDTVSYMRLLQEIVLTQGIPLALYHDHHGIFKVAEKASPFLEEQLSGKEPITQLGRLLDELGTRSIAANSPQAKGRVERLWGTFQDRLASELRLAGAKTLAEANAVLAQFLPDYNRKFTVPARESGTAYRKPDPGFVPEHHFCLKYPRTVGADNVVRCNNHRLQILPTQHRISFARCQVEVHDRLDGSLAVHYQGQDLPTKPAPSEAGGLRVSCPRGQDTLKNRRYAPPAPDHPWRGIYRKYPLKASQ